MKKLMLSIFLIALAAAASAEEATSVTFGTPSVVVGTEWTETTGYGSSMRLTIDNGTGVGSPHNAPLTPEQALQQRSVAVTKTMKVTAMQGPKISEVEVDYSEVKINGDDVTSTFSGHTWRVSMNGNHVTDVTRINGATPTAEELAFVGSDNSNIGQSREMSRTFGGKSVAIGQLLHAQNPEDLFDVQSGFEVDAFSMTLASITGEGTAQTATFDVELTISSSVKKRKGAPAADPDPFAQSSTSMELDGTLTANVASGRMTAFDLRGPATASASKEARGTRGETGRKGPNGNAPRMMSVSGAGTGFMRGSFEYAQP